MLEQKQSFARRRGPLMSWSSARKTTNQIELTFEIKEEAIAYAERYSLEYKVQNPARSKT